MLLGSIFGATLGFAVGYFVAGTYDGMYIAEPYGLTAAVWGGVALGAFAFVVVAMFAAEVFGDR